MISHVYDKQKRSQYTTLRNTTQHLISAWVYSINHYGELSIMKKDFNSANLTFTVKKFSTRLQYDFTFTRDYAQYW